MSNFALDVNTPQGDIISSLNYVLSNLGTFDANIVANIANVAITSANVVTANTVTGQLRSVNAGTLSYLYNYVNIKYANNATGSSGFSSNSTNSNYYGVNNTQDGTISSNPTDYVWSRVTGGFGTTKGLYFTTVGGGQIFFSANATAPSVRYSPVIDNTAILLQNLANSLVTTTTINPGAVTNVGIATQTIQTDNIGLGVITADLLSANLVIAKDIRADVGVIGDLNSPGYWMQANTGSARFAGTMSIGNSLSVGNNAIVGSGLSVGANAVIGNNLGVGNNAVIGSNLSVGSNAVIGNNLFVGNNTQIGGNLVVAGLITAGNLNTNTVSTTNIQQNSVTDTAGFLTTTPRTDLSPVATYSGYDATNSLYNWSTANVVATSVGLICTTANVTNVISGFIDLFGTVNSASDYIPQMYTAIYRVEGNTSTYVGGTSTSTPAIQVYPGGSSHYTTQTFLPYRINETAIIDNFTITPPQTIRYTFLYGSFVGVTVNAAPTIGYDQVNSYSLTVTNYKR